MTFISMSFVLFLIIVLLLFYIAPVKSRWRVLLGASLLFYYQWCREAFPIFLATILVSYCMGRMIGFFVDADKKKRRLTLAFSIILAVVPLFVIKEGNFILFKLQRSEINIIVPLGISFYTLQIVSYLVDIFNQEIKPETNVFRYALYISYFPQIIQGPIPRYRQLAKQLNIGQGLDERMFIKGFHLILWGCFLKLMIADKAGVIVDSVFDSPSMYKGVYVLAAGILYSIQLYTDFQSCVCIAKGVSELFGISLADNFSHPYFSQSVAEFWRRWHISLSSWLRDYVYIPLGGNRKGNVRKYVNIMVVFAVSGMWHGSGYKYVFWGLMHGGYQIIGSITKPVRERIYRYLGWKYVGKAAKLVRGGFTFLCVTVAWIIFRADSLHEGIAMVCSIFTVYNPWILFDDSLLSLGLSWKEWIVLLASIALLIKVSLYQKEHCVRDKILEQNVVVRGLVYLVAIMVVVVFGTYGFGFETKDFIYGGF